MLKNNVDYQESVMLHLSSRFICTGVFSKINAVSSISMIYMDIKHDLKTKIVSHSFIWPLNSQKIKQTSDKNKEKNINWGIISWSNAKFSVLL